MSTTELEMAYLKIEALELTIETILESQEIYLSNPTESNTDLLRQAVEAMRTEFKGRVLH